MFAKNYLTIMVILIWICIAADVAAAIFLLISSTNSDPAGAAMIWLPVILLLLLAGGGYYLMQHNSLNWALTVSGLPVIVLLYLLFISVT